MLLKSWTSYKQQIKRKSKLSILLLATTFLFCEAKAVEAVSFGTRRTVESNGETAFQTATDLQIDDASNIYVVDGINNTLEVFDTSIWFLPGYQLRPGKRLRIRASAAAV